MYICIPNFSGTLADVRMKNLNKKIDFCLYNESVRLNVTRCKFMEFMDT